MACGVLIWPKPCTILLHTVVEPWVCKNFIWLWYDLFQFSISENNKHKNRNKHKHSQVSNKPLNYLKLESGQPMHARGLHLSSKYAHNETNGLMVINIKWSLEEYTHMETIQTFRKCTVYIKNKKNKAF